MTEANDNLRTVWWDAGLCLIDQTLLPATVEVVRCSTIPEAVEAIRSMQVRGAPAIGVTAAYAMVLAAQQSPAATAADLLADLERAKASLDAARPTAINLAWATARMLRVARGLAGRDPAAIAAALLATAEAIRDEDEAMCRAIGQHGARLLAGQRNVLTHCNAGGLATAAYGTALAPIRAAHERGQELHVWVDETRPFLQGARLTAWELQQAGIPLTLITDNMAGHFMQRGAVDCIIVGADRIAANGDVANKIGTYTLAVLAEAHGVPFYVAAPTSTIDLATPDGAGIPIEERRPEEVTHLAGAAIAPAGVAAAHPAFDVTPHRLVKAIITERGVLYPPYEATLAATVNAA
ncbi:MAG TPA: S-methyl-5-thioribose-1-phosphate isomerase, partial [Herpetosiphonaceae bacterium]|nr:S-methyl-5-thioribose-1-phosphate isomerase [Herpetosiphonaceae bacterium]